MPETFNDDFAEVTDRTIEVDGEETGLAEIAFIEDSLDDGAPARDIVSFLAEHYLEHSGFRDDESSFHLDASMGESLDLRDRTANIGE